MGYALIGLILGVLDVFLFIFTSQGSDLFEEAALILLIFAPNIRPNARVNILEQYFAVPTLDLSLFIPQLVE